MGQSQVLRGQFAMRKERGGTPFQHLCDKIVININVV